MRVMVKRCPFCGQSPMVLPVDPQNDGDAWGEVRCVTSGCPAKPSVRDGAGSSERGSGWYKLQAIKRWNQRKNLISTRLYTIDDIYTLDVSKQREKRKDAVVRKVRPVRVYVPEGQRGKK